MIFFLAIILDNEFTINYDIFQGKYFGFNSKSHKFNVVLSQLTRVKLFNQGESSK